MSTKGIYSAVSGAVAQSRQLDTISNNIANANTPGFKKDKQVFKEYLTAYEKQPEVLETPKVPASIESFYPLNGGDKSFVDVSGTSTSFTQGALKLTGNALDLGIEGDAFFEVMTPAGSRFTKNGNFTLNGEGVVVTKQGYPLLMEGDEGTPVEDRMIRIEEGGNFTVTSQADVFVGGDNFGRLSMQTVTEKDALHKQGNSLYTLRENFDNQVVRATNFKVHQGAYEQSNVNIVQEMTNMINATRVFESTQKAIQTYDQMNSKLANEVPRFR
ncbi:MAG: flagellar basal-body rod protein FlgF [Bdellovibrionales bacterium]|nr:flagellar basal-body rod protein FlgF [Bdellovibrionales bacterium]NQZ18507.1 flagellar basal-body rod protein FlgF [Bdellovibrionales bacterium]